jgi:nitrite reductase/ring-hydroxylating ferredoxin subunit
LSDVGDPGAVELSWGDGEWPLSLFVVRRGSDAFGFHNRCPHAGHELNLRAHEFLTREGDLILCRSHGARFRIEDGFCVLGPCVGAALRSLPVDIVAGDVVAELEDLVQLAAAAKR